MTKKNLKVKDAHITEGTIPQMAETMTKGKPSED